MDIKIRNLNGVPAADRYCPALNYELSGKTFELVIDGWPDMRLRFAGETTLILREGDGPEQAVRYMCLKADETTYFVTLEPDDEAPRVCISFVLDLSNRLVTRVTAREDTLRRRGISTKFAFGAIRGEDGRAAAVRHAFTDDLVGTFVQWTTGPKRTCVHEYARRDACRVDCYGSGAQAAGIARAGEVIPAAYIRIKNGFYLTCMTERIEDRALSLCCLQDYNRMLAVGYALGPLPADGGGSGLVMLGAYGRFVENEKAAY